MNSPFAARRCWAEIDYSALKFNLDALKSHAGGAPGIMAVVKANAYGHGVSGVVRALDGDVRMFGVATLAEAREVRLQAPTTPIFILGPALPEERAEIAARGFIPAVSSAEEARAYASAGACPPVPIHLVIDTGMGRIGVREDACFETAKAIDSMPGICLAGIASHLPVADEDAEFTGAQLDRYRQLVAQIRSAGIHLSASHVENTAGLIGWPAQAGDLVRAGLALYGSAPIPSFQQKLRPVLAWKTRITLIRDVAPGRGISYGRTFITTRCTRIATLAVGYADGFQRHLSNRGASVLIGGRRCPLLGRVTMDQILVDVTDAGPCEIGGEAVLLGAQGPERILAAEMAALAGTIPWDIFTGIGNRVERVPA